jgi:uncharacterized protein HemY
MSTIAYRIHHNSVSPYHPSLVVLLYILGSIHVKHGKLHKAMQVFELACKDASPSEEEEEEDPDVKRAAPRANLLA